MAALLSIAPAAHATTFTFTATGPGINSSGTLTVVADPTIANAFDVNGISGTFNGVAITGLLPCPAYDPANPCNNNTPRNFSFDNLLYNQIPALDFNGIGFSIGTAGYQGNFFFNANGDPATYVFFDSNNNQVLLTSFTASPVPEPGSLVLLGSGIFGILTTVRRRIKT